MWSGRRLPTLVKGRLPTVHRRRAPTATPHVPEQERNGKKARRRGGGGVASSRGAGVHDHVALDEIEMCGDLMIAASSSGEDRLTPARIDEVLKVGRPG